MSDVNANVHINIDTTGALVNLKRLESEINSFQRTVASSNVAATGNQQALNKALLDGIRNTGLFDAKLVNAHDSISRFNDQLDRGKLSLGQYTRYAASQLPGMSRVFKKEFDTIQQVAESRVKKINTQYIALGKTVDGVTRAIAATPTSLGRGYSTDLALATQRQQLFNKMIDDGSTKLLNWGKNTQWAGRQLMVGFSIPMAALGTVAAKTFMEIDKATTALKRVYGDLNTTTGEINANVDALKALGAEYTKYGISLQETIDIGARAAATGAKNQDLTAATEQTLRLATLGQIDYNQALDATISLQSAFGISSKDLGEAIDYLNVVENQTILTLDDMTLAVPRVATVIKGLGGDVKDLAVFMTAMREGGVSAENAANALKSGLASLINPTKAAKEHLGGVGINIEKIVKTNKGDLMGIITSFGQALNTLDDFQRQQALEKVFGKYQYARMGALFSNITKDSSQAARAMDLAAMSAQELANVANKELNTVSESTTVKFQAAMEQLKISIAPLGEAFLKGITPVVNLVTKIADAFNNLPDGVKNALAVITAAVAGIGPVLLMGVGLIGNGLANLVKGIQFLRRNLARIRGDGEAFNYMSVAELEAVAATNSLNSSSQTLTGTLSLQRNAVAALTAEYERFAVAAGIAGGAMRGVGGGSTGKAPMKAPIRRAMGGTIPGTGNTDTVPAMLTPGEFVVNKQSTAKNLPLLKAINDGQIQGYQFGGMAKALSRFAGRRTQFAHASESRSVAGKEASSLLRPAEAQFYKSKGSRQSVQVSALSRLTLGVSDLENQALRTAVGKGLDPTVFAARIKSTKHTPRLFERISLPKGTKVRFREILSEEIGKIKKNPMFDDDFARAFNRAEKRMTKELQYDKNLQSRFVSAISSAREDAFTRMKFGIPKGSPSAKSVKDARILAAKRGLPTKDQPFFYYHSGQRKASALVKMPDGRIVGVQSDATRSIIKMNKGGIIGGMKYAPPGGQVSQSRRFYGIPFFKRFAQPFNAIGKKASDLRTYLSATHGTTYEKTWMDPLSREGRSQVNVGAGMESSAVHGPGIYQGPNRSTLASYVPKTFEDGGRKRIMYKIGRNTVPEDNYLYPGRDNIIYRNPRSIGEIYKLIKSKGYISLEEVELMVKKGMLPQNTDGNFLYRNQALRDMGYRGIISPGGGASGEIIDLVSGARKSANMVEIGKLSKLYYTSVFRGREFLQGSTMEKINLRKLPKNLVNEIKRRKQQKKIENMSDEEYYASSSQMSTLNSGGIVPMRLATGNIVPGMGNRDTVPAMLTPGEFVINKKATSKNLPLLRAINDGDMQGYNDGDVVQSRRTGYSAPPQIASQTRQMEWSSRAAESAAATKAAQRWEITGNKLTNALTKVAAHIVEPQKGLTKLWKPKQLTTDLQAVNNYMNRVKTVSKSMLTNTETLQKISKSTGLSIRRVQRELENFARGQHPITAKSARVLEKVASMDEAASRMAQQQGRRKNVFGAKTSTGYQAGMTRAILRERRIAGNDLYRDRGRFRYTGPTIQTQRSGARVGRPVPPPMVEPTAHGGMMPMMMGGGGGQAQYSSTSIRAREIMQEKGLSGQQGRVQALKLARKEAKMQSRPRFGGAMAGVGGVIGMASMIPFMAQDEEGKFMGMNANMLGMGMMGAGMIAPLYGAISSGAGALAAALGVATSAVVAPVAALAAVAVGAYLLKKGLDNTVEAARKYADSLTTSTQEQKAISDVFGTRTYAERRKEKKTWKITGLKKEQQDRGKEFLTTDPGKNMLEEAKTSLQNRPSMFAKNLGTQLAQSVVSGAMAATDAKAIGAAIAESLGRQDLTAGIVGQIDKILAPNGDDVTNTPIKIMGEITTSINLDEKSLESEANTAAQNFNTDWWTSDNFLNFGWIYSGEYDAMVAGGIAYTESVINNTKSILSSYDDQIMAQNDVIKGLDDQIAKEEDKTKKEELETKRRFAIRQRDDLQKKRMAAAEERRTKSINVLYGEEEGRAERRHAIRQSILEQAPGLDTQALLEPSLRPDGSAAVRQTHRTNRKTGRDEVITYTGGLLGLYYTEKTDKMLTDPGKIEAQVLVDLSTGAIDPVALNILTTAEATKGNTANMVLGTIMDLEVKGDVEKAGQLTIIAAQLADNPEILTIFNTQADGMTPDQLLVYGDLLVGLRDLPPDIYKTVAVELQGMTPEQMKVFKDNLLDLQEMNIDPIQLIVEGGIGAVSEATKATDTLTGSLKRYKKQIDGLKKGTKETRLENSVTLVNKILTPEGVEITPDQMQEYINELMKDTGMTEDQIWALPNKTFVQTFYFKAMADDLRKQAETLKATASTASPDIAAALLQQAKELDAAATALEGAASSTASGSGYGGATEDVPKKPPGGGAGSGTKSLMQQILEQFKLYVDATATMKKLNDAKKRFYNEIVKGQGLIPKLIKMPGVGTNAALMEYLSGLTPDELKKWMKENTKGGKLNKKGQNISRRVIEAGIGQTVALAQQQNVNQKQQIQAANILTGGMGGKYGRISSNLVQQITGDPAATSQFMKIYSDVQNNVKGANAAMRQFIQQQQQALNGAIELARAQDPIQAEIDDLTIAHEQATKEIEKQKQPLEDQIDIYNDQIDQLQRLNDADNHRIQGLNRQKELIQRQIDAMQYQNELDQRKIDALRREDELRNRVSDALSHDLDILSKQEQKIRDGYQKRIDALNKVAEINQHIIEQQQQQLGLSQALSEGDIYAAAGQVIQARQSNAQFAAQQQQQALQTGMENAISGLRTAGGLTRDQAEQQIANIKEQSYQTSLKIQVIEDRIYQRNLDMIPLKDAQYQLDLQTIPIQDAIYDREQSIYDIQTNKITPLQDQIDALEDQQAIIDRLFEADIDRLEAQQLANEQIDAQKNNVEQLGQQWDAVRKLIVDINKLIKDGGVDAANITIPRPKPGESPKNYLARLNAFKTDAEARIQAAKKARLERENKAAQQNKFAGGFIRAATGMLIPGVGGMDSVPVMATPGEFMMRKAAVKKYGSALMEAINTGSFNLPKYNMPSVGQIVVQPARTTNASINAPVYNGYSVNVNVAGTNASADEIANRTITRIKEMQNVNIRSARG